MVSAFVQGLRTAVQRWPIVLLLFLASVASALSFTAAAWSWLSLALDSSVATRTLLTDLDVNVFIDLFVQHGESLHMLVLTGVVLAGAFGLLGVWLNAIAVVAVREEIGLLDCLRGGVGLSARYLRLAVFVNLCHAMSLLAAFGLGRGLTSWLAESSVEMTYYWAVLGSGVLGGLLVLFFATVHDHARVHVAARGVGAARAFAWGMSFVGRREWRALPLALLLTGSGFLAWVVYQSVGMLITPSTTFGLLLSLLWGQALLLSRMLIRVWTFAAAAELQHLGEWP